MNRCDAESDRASVAQALKDELRGASASFRKRGRRHFLSTPDVIYCAFSTPTFSVSPAEAQRDAGRRLLRFGLGESEVRGKRVLDLGSNNGAMLFELSNFGPASGLGVEYDGEKVDLARRIAAFAGLAGLEFRQADVDQLEAKDLGPPFEVVLCLALEAHVERPKRLYALLGELTRGTLYFEANASTRPGEVESSLREAGFSGIQNLGVCDDDIVPRNNRRPIFTARKA
jgi:2-polyprenyl-3-methyl-5-hydroxy-6-metoxy-1,4-benzoquinol methylase